MPDVQQTTQRVKETIQNEVKKIPPTSDRNMIAALSYIWVLSLLFLLFKRNDEFIAFHARQGLVLNALCLVWWIPLLGWIIFALAAAGMVLGFMNAWQGKEWKIPYIYGWSQWVKSKGL